MAIHAQKFDELERDFEHGNEIERAVLLGMKYGNIDGAHHKMWVIDQMIRILAGAYYSKLIEVYENVGEYEWDVGIAP